MFSLLYRSLLALLALATACGTETTHLRLEGEAVSRELVVSDRRLATLSFHVDGELAAAAAPESAEFSIRFAGREPLTARDFRVSSVDAGPAPTREISLQLDGPDGCEVSVRYWVEEDDVLRKTVTVEAPPEGAERIAELAVEDLILDGATEAPRITRSIGEERDLSGISRVRGAIGLGQPVYLDDRLFAALHYPGGANTFDDGTLRLAHFPGRRLEGESLPLTSKTAVIGFDSRPLSQSPSSSHDPARAPPSGFGKGAAQRFEEYVQSWALPPRRMRHFIDAFHLRGRANIGVGINGAPTAEELEELYQETPVLRDLVRTEENAVSYARATREFSGEYGVELDSFTIDGGWQDPSTVFEVDPLLLPNGFTPIAEEAEVPIGLWNSLAGFRLDLQTLADAHGFSICPPINLAFDLSDPTYHKAIRQALAELIESYDPAYWKQDFNFLACPVESDAHGVGPAQSFEANLDALLALIRFEREQNPDVSISQTTGIWPSPFWREYVDAIPSIRADYGFDRAQPAFDPRDWHITFVDTSIYRNFALDNAQYPTSRLMTHGIIRDRYVPIGGANEALRSWANGVIAHLAPGLALQELYVDPTLLPPDHARFLAEALRWSDAEAETLNRGGRIFGGNPQTGLPYGFSHTRDGEQIVFLRNPSPESRSIEVPHDLAGSSTVEVLYPQRNLLAEPVSEEEPWTATLEPFEMLVARIGESPSKIEDGIKYDVVYQDGAPTLMVRGEEPELDDLTSEMNEDGTALHLQAPSGSETRVLVTVDAEVDDVVFSLDGTPVAPLATNRGPCGPVGCPLVHIDRFVVYELDIPAGEHELAWELGEDVTLRSIWAEQSAPVELTPSGIDLDTALLTPEPGQVTHWQLLAHPAGGEEVDPKVLDGIFDGDVELETVEMLVVSEDADTISLDLEKAAGGPVRIPTVIDPEAGTIAVMGTRARVGDGPEGDTIELNDIAAVGTLVVTFKDYYGTYDAETGSITLPVDLSLDAIILNFAFDFDLVATTGYVEQSHNSYVASGYGQILAADDSFRLAGPAIVPADVPFYGDLPAVVSLAGRILTQ